MTRPSVAVRLLVLALVIGGCTKETIVFRDREPFNAPPDSAAGFLGYYNVADKITACGNCHVGHQRDWVTSAHADAYDGLVSNASNPQSFCFSCHAVTARGNRATGPAGHDVVQDTAYHDVQCENCHGPGYEHVTEPDRPGNVPLARIGLADSVGTCAACHSGTHHPFADEWKQSGHAQVLATPAGRPECASCHEGKAVLLAWGARVNYIERDSTGYQPFTCAVCHDPHGSPNRAQLRWAINTPDPARNLCMKCHLNRTEPQVTSSRGPHGPQGGVLLGAAGYWPPGFEYDSTLFVTSHGSQANPNLCAGCHLGGFEVTDPASGNFVFQAAGHLFKATPCVDAQGVPTGDDSCALNAASRSFRTCVTAGCHQNANAAASALNNSRGDLLLFASQLWVDADGSGTINAGDTGYLTQVPASEFSTTDNKLTVAEGALFNVRLVGPGYYANGDKSLGAHNPFLSRALLRSSIEAMQATYGLAPPSPAVQAGLARPLRAPAPQISAR